MRLREIEEALPGQVSRLGRALAKVGMGGKAAAAEKAMRDQAKQAYKLWLTVVPKVQAGGVNMNDPVKYSDYFGAWMAQNLRMDRKNAIIQKGVRQMKSYGNNITPANVQDLILQMMGQQRASALQNKQARAPRSQATGAAQVMKKASDGNTYKWVVGPSGAEWHDQQGNMAPDNIQQELGNP